MGIHESCRRISCMGAGRRTSLLDIEGTKTSLGSSKKKKDPDGPKHCQELILV